VSKGTPILIPQKVCSAKNVKLKIDKVKHISEYQRRIQEKYEDLIEAMEKQMDIDDLEKELSSSKQIELRPIVTNLVKPQPRKKSKASSSAVSRTHSRYNSITAQPMTPKPLE